MRQVVPILLGLALSMAWACSPGPVSLTVDVRTDFHPGADFGRVVVALTRQSAMAGAEVREESFVVDGTEDFLEGQRVAEYSDVPRGPINLEVRLVDGAGRTVLARNVVLDLHDSYAVVVLITSNCAGVECPGAAGNPALSECLDAQCIAPECSEMAPELCPEPCVRDADCTPQPGCTTRHCIIGTCFCADDLMTPDASVMDSGPPDTGPPDTGPPDTGPPDTGPPCGCTPGATESRMTACGRCNTGTQTDVRTCSADCQWGGFVNGSCTGVSGCVPGSETGCANGDSCGRRICGSDCNYGGCTPIAGGQCLRIAPGGTTEGTNFRCCGTYRWQYCLAGCVWSTDCVSCNAVTSCPGCG